MTASSGAAPGGLRAFRVDGQVALVTGGAQGIGLACATLLAEAGARVVLLDRDAAALEDACARLPGAGAHTLDVTDEAAVLFLASPAAAMITGHILAVDGGYLAQ